MIARIYGVVLHKDDDRIVVDANGTGYEIVVPAGFPATLHHPAEVWCWHVVKEDSQTLFGFPDLASRDLALRCAETDGVGPVIASRFVATCGFAAIQQAVQTGDHGALPKVRGLGAGKVQLIVEKLRKTGGLAATVDPRIAQALAALRQVGVNTTEVVTQLVNEKARDAPAATPAGIVKAVIGTLRG